MKHWNFVCTIVESCKSQVISSVHRNTSSKKNGPLHEIYFLSQVVIVTQNRHPQK